MSEKCHNSCLGAAIVAIGALLEKQRHVVPAPWRSWGYDRSSKVTGCSTGGPPWRREDLIYIDRGASRVTADELDPYENSPPS